MKILLTSHQFLPEYSAGTEVLTLETARALRIQGHEVSIFTSSPSKEGGGCCMDYVYDGFRVRCYIPRSTRRADVYDVARHEYEDHDLGLLFETYLGEIRPDVVHFFHLMRLTTSAVEAAERLGIATVFTPTDFWAICPAVQLRLPDNSVCAGVDPDAINCVKHMLRTIRPLKKLRFLEMLPDRVLRLVLDFLDVTPLAGWRPVVNIRSMRRRLNHIRQVLSRVGRIIAPSKIMLELFQRHGYRGDQIALSRYGLVGVHAYPAHSALSVENGPVIGFIGSLYPHKGAHVLLKAIATLPAELHFSVQIYGSELENIEYMHLLRELAGADPRITFSGAFPNERIGEVLAGIDVLCVPSVWLENIPLVLLSAQAAKVPVIATNFGGLSEVVEDGRNGFLFPSGDHQALADIIGNLVRNPALLKAITAQITPPKDIMEYAYECVSEYTMAIAAKASG